jgi:hypothetical protein
LIACEMRVISPCRLEARGAFADSVASSSSSAPASRSWVANWSKLICAACSARLGLELGFFQLA